MIRFSRRVLRRILSRAGRWYRVGALITSLILVPGLGLPVFIRCGGPNSRTGRPVCMSAHWLHRDALVKGREVHPIRLDPGQLILMPGYFYHDGSPRFAGPHRTLRWWQRSKLHSSPYPGSRLLVITNIDGIRRLDGNVGLMRRDLPPCLYEPLLSILFADNSPACKTPWVIGNGEVPV